jgi:NitT/TauT family transport system substrate-binding protein
MNRAVGGRAPSAPLPLAGLLAACAAGILAACGDAPAPVDGTGSPGGGVARVVRMGHFPSVTHAHGLVGHALTREGKGWFEERLGAGIRVEWTVYNAGPSAMEALLSDAADVVYVGPNPVINAHAKTGGEDIRVISGATLGGSALVVPGASAAKGPGDFRGKRLGTPQLGNTQDVACRAWLRTAGVHVTQAGGDAVILPTAHADMLALFKNGELDAAWTVEPWVSRMEAEAGGRVLLLDDASVTTVLACRRGFLDSDRELLRRIVAAHAELTRWIVAEPAAARALVAKELEAETRIPVAPEILEKAWPRMQFRTELPAGAFDAFTKAAVEAGFLKEAPDLSRLFDTP